MAARITAATVIMALFLYGLAMSPACDAKLVLLPYLDCEIDHTKRIFDDGTEVIVTSAVNNNTPLIALNQATGATVWGPIEITGYANTGTPTVNIRSSWRVQNPWHRTSYAICNCS
jgi:hypothetical protein